MNSNLLKAVFKLDNLERAWRVIHENGRVSKSEAVKLELEAFYEDSPHKLRSLHRRLLAGSFKFGKSKGIPIPKLDARGNKTAKIRPIVLAPVESRIVQRALLNVLVELPSLQSYVKTPYSFGGIRKERIAEESEGVSVSPPENLSAVPAAINAVLREIERGARYIACADIKAFFTRIPKAQVSGIISRAVNDLEFINFLESAIKVELSNLTELRSRAADFPTEDLGVAQGNSLSPLLGNIILSDFDRVMNEGDSRCIRYIDDFIILAPTEKIANARLRKATALLAKLQMSLSPDKSTKGVQPIRREFEFLGISIAPGKIRPASKAQSKFIASLESILDESRTAFIGLRNGKDIDKRKTLIATLKRVDGMIDGWGKHYWFCNDLEFFAKIDGVIENHLRGFLGAYKEIRSQLPFEDRNKLLGISELAKLRREPFRFPSQVLK